MDEIQIRRLPGCKNVQSIGIHSSNTVDSILEEEEDIHSLRVSDMIELRNPAKLFCRTELNLDETLISNEDYEEEDYNMVTGANRQLHRQTSQNPQIYTTRQDPTQAKIHQLLRKKNSLTQITKSQQQ